MKSSISEGIRIAGKVKINTYRTGMVEQIKPYLNQISLCKELLGPHSSDIFSRSVSERIQHLVNQIEQIKQSFFIRTAVECSNLVVDSPGFGIDLIIQRLTGNNAYSLNITFIEIGTGNTTPNVNDIALGSPSMRLPVSFQEDYGATDAILQAYVTDGGLPNGTYSEVGSFVDGTSAIGSGQMFNHALLSPAYTKVSGQDTTIEVDFTLVNS
jgi:hypothetical protein